MLSCLFLYHTDNVPYRYGEIVNINLVRDRKTGKSKGFCFVGYEDQRSTILAVDNFNGIKVLELKHLDLIFSSRSYIHMHQSLY